LTHIDHGQDQSKGLKGHKTFQELSTHTLKKPSKDYYRRKIMMEP
jgi:hypothetical protein